MTGTWFARQREQSGADENRTRDLLHAMQALSQLSYSPERTRRPDERENFTSKPSSSTEGPAPPQPGRRLSFTRALSPASA